MGLTADLNGLSIHVLELTVDWSKAPNFDEYLDDNDDDRPAQILRHMSRSKFEEWYERDVCAQHSY